MRFVSGNNCTIQLGLQTYQSASVCFYVPLPFLSYIEVRYYLCMFFYGSLSMRCRCRNSLNRYYHHNGMCNTFTNIYIYIHTHTRNESQAYVHRCTASCLQGCLRKFHRRRAALVDTFTTLYEYIVYVHKYLIVCEIKLRRKKAGEEERFYLYRQS